MTKYSKWFGIIAAVGAAACLLLWRSMSQPKFYPVSSLVDLGLSSLVDFVPKRLDVHYRAVDVDSKNSDADSGMVDVHRNVDYVEVGVDSRKVDGSPENVEGVVERVDSVPGKVDSVSPIRVDVASSRVEDESVICSHKNLKTVNTFHDFLSNTSSECTDLIQLPGFHRDNNFESNWVCVDPRYLPMGDCLVYVFIDGDDQFPESAHVKLGCKVFVFEPKEAPANRSAAVKYYQTVMATRRDYEGKILKNQLMTLIDNLGHQDKQIDLLKIDTAEGEELIILGNIFFAPRPLYKNIKQINVVIRLREGLSPELQQYWLYFELLQCHDFRLIRSDVAEYNGNMKLYELLWIRKQ
ncbi:uncharacterized protein LOC122246620 [Penaeus japonicus]|uniref:uncharacterized protein LOC122246620 n=1 Tax=Penaeus japonicus TaxID=27405 RepID=UPI001C70C681|nr:uncharacterized protein LOC122246620 [Penaeus japonicus]